MPHTEMDNMTLTRLALISERAQQEPKFQFTSSAHLLSKGFLKEYYYNLGSGRASGIDGVSWKGYRAGHPVFNGLAMVFIQSGFEAGPIKLKAEAAGLQSAQVAIEAEPPRTPEPFIPSITQDEKKDKDKEGTETYPYL